MGVYIKDMEMPKGKQIIELRIYADGEVTRVHDRTCRKIAEATEVPEPHGRLIDTDALEKDLDTIWFSDNGTCHDVYACLRDAPTIIERSK